MAHVTRVLVVEDDHAMRYAITRTFEKHGFDVDVAEGESDAIELGKVRQYCAVMVDLLLPAIDNGRRVIAEIGRAYPTVPLYVLTGADVKLSELSGHVRAVYRKPVDVDALAEIVQQSCLDHA